MSPDRVKVLAAVVVIMAGCGTAGADGPTETQRACADYVLAVQDWRDGILTDGELRDEVKSAHGRLEGSTLEQPARDALAGVTSGSLVDALDSMTVLIRRCGVVMG